MLNPSPPAPLLHPGTLKPSPDLHPARLLMPAFEVVPFAGRAAEIAKLDDWLALPYGVAIRVIHGPEGVGKTRLAQHWMGVHRDNGLSAGFLSGPLNAALAAKLVAAAPCIAAIDGAEARDGLPELLDALAACKPDRPIRVLLLARHLGDWWIELSQRERPLTPLVQRLSATARLEPLLDAGARRHELLRAAQALAEHLKHKLPATLGAPEDPRYERPLFLHMAALSSVMGLDVVDGDIVGALLDHEERGWIRRAGLHSAPVRKRRRWLERIRHLAASIVLRGGIPDRETLHKLATALDVHKTAELTVEDIPPHVGGCIGPITPGPIADALLARALAGVQHETLEEMLHGLDDADLSSAFMALASSESVDPAVAEAAERMLLGTAFPARVLPALNAVRALGSGARLAAALAETLREQGTLAEANAIPPLSPRASLTLAEVALWIAETRLVSDMSEHELADTMNHYGEWLAALGRRKEALALAREALDPLRFAAASQPELVPELARSLRNLGKNLTALRQRDPALPMLEEAVGLLRGLADSRPTPYRLELAAALRELGHNLASRANFEPALAATHESVDILRQLAEAKPDLALPELAQSLCALGRIHSREGEHERALSATQEAVDLMRQLVLVQPDCISPFLAIGLNNLGATLAYMGEQRRALRATQEAIERFRRLSRIQPDPANLARSFGVLGHILGDDAARAAAAFAEGLRVLLPSYHENSNQLWDLRDALARDYTRVCEKLGERPDPDLLETTDPG